MKEKREDVRTRATRQRLQQALVGLMEERPLKDLTVKELCERADVNRSTFYLHYYDIYDLMDELKEQLGEELAAILSEMPLPTGNGAFSAHYAALFSLLGRHAETCTVLLGRNGDQAFVGKLFDIGREKCVSEWMRAYPQAGREAVEFCYVFISTGALGTLRQWFEAGCASPPEELARRVEQLVAASLKTLER